MWNALTAGASRKSATMKSLNDKAIEILVKSITENMDATDALKISQSALNLAHVAQVQEQTRLTAK